MAGGTRGLLLASLVAGALVATAAPAHAYPQWQLSTGAVRCNQCHYAPGGGGLVNGYGRDAAGDELSMFQGNGQFLHGAVELPAWLALGGDLRGAFLARNVEEPGGTDQALFPMQADLHGRVSLPFGFSVYGTAGVRGQTREDAAVVPLQNYQPVSTSRLISREHFVTWQPAAQGIYARAGRYFAPFGLRLAEHVTYVRRDLGFNQLQESYNLSYGFLSNEWEAHVTGFVADFARHIGSEESGAAVYYERRLFDEKAAVGGQTRLAFGQGMDRLIVGSVGKYYLDLAKTLFLAELNVVHQMFEEGRIAPRQQFVGAAGFSVLPMRGLFVTALAERNQQAIGVRDTGWTAATGLVNWFPYPHVELQIMGRLQFADASAVARTFLAQLHYFL